MIHIVLLTFIVLISLLWDLKSRVIPNAITISGMIMGIILNAALHGSVGIIDSALGMVTALFLLLIPFHIGGLGGGDVKLMMAIGAVMGFKFVINDIMYTALSGAVIAVGIIAWQKKWKKAMKRLGFYFVSTFLLQSLVKINEVECPTTFPYGLAIASGTFITLYMQFSG